GPVSDRERQARGPRGRAGARTAAERPQKARPRTGRGAEAPAALNNPLHDMTCENAEAESGQIEIELAPGHDWKDRRDEEEKPRGRIPPERGQARVERGPSASIRRAQPHGETRDH